MYAIGLEKSSEGINCFNKKIDRRSNRMRKQRMSEILNMGTAIGLCTAISIVLGALLKNVALCLSIGSSIGVVIGAIYAIKNR